VHQQFCQLTRLLYQDGQQPGPQRLAQLAERDRQEEAQERLRLRERIDRISTCCLACGQPLEGRPQMGPLYYGETDDGRCGMMEESCLARLVLLPFRQQKALPEGSPPSLDLLRASARQSSFALFRRDTQTAACTLVRCNADGQPLSQTPLSLEEKGLRLFAGNNPLDYLRRVTLTNPQQPERPVLLLLRQVDTEQPTAVLQSVHYDSFRQCLENLRCQLAVPA
jgi:hypothetical protein